jgi:hypothetical protein
MLGLIFQVTKTFSLNKQQWSVTKQLLIRTRILKRSRRVMLNILRTLKKTGDLFSPDNFNGADKSVSESNGLCPQTPAVKFIP